MGCGAGFELADAAEHFGEGRFADLALEFVLQAIERGNDAESATFALRLEREKVGARILRIDFALQKSLGFEGRDAVAQVAARSGEGPCQLRGFDLTRGLKKERREDKRLEEAEAVGGEHAGRERFEASRGAVDREHGTFTQEGVNAHDEAELAQLAELPPLAKVV